MAVRTLTVDIIGACQNKCLFCYSRAKPDARIEFDRFKQHVESFPELSRVEIGGGEPFLHPDLLKFVRFGLERGLSVDVSTNGLVYLDSLEEAISGFEKRFGLQVNFPAANKSIYDFITQTTDHFPILIMNLRRFLEITENVRLAMTLCKENVGEIVDVAHFTQLNGLLLSVGLMVLPCKYIATPLTPEEIDNVSLTIASLNLGGFNIASNWRKDGLTPCPAIAVATGMQLVEGCAGLEGRKVHIDPEGQRKGCEFLDS